MASAAAFALLAGCDATGTSTVSSLATSTSAACANRANNTIAKLTECVTLDGVRSHQAAFQAIADANGGTRADGTPGYAASADYVAETLQAAGWNVERVPFQYDALESALEQFTPFAVTYTTGAFSGTGFGDVTGPVIPVDLSLGDPSLSTSGCEASDFAGLDFSGPNDIALIQRGVCFFSVKAVNAEAAGAEAVVFFNQGNSPDREGLIVGNAGFLPDGSPSNLTIPVVGASFADGVALAEAGSTARVYAAFVTRTSENVIAESQTGDPSNVVMVGAHLDSVNEGPGINDNASGSAAILETALRMAKVRLRNQVRFAWWGAEEVGLIGSNAYVESLSPDEIDAIALYLNFDMIGSPNYVRFVLDSDFSELGGTGAEGSSAIEAFFADFYTSRGLAFETESFLSGSDWSSDWIPFFDYGIPFGGVWTGASGIKTPAQVAVYGGIAGEQYDPCYHLACDTFDNVSLEVLDQNADAVAASVLHFSMSTTLVNGVKGKGNFRPRNERASD